VPPRHRSLAAESERWADLIVHNLIAIAVLLCGCPAVPSAHPQTAASVFSTLRVSTGSVEWHGLLLGMPKSDLEQVLGLSLNPEQPWPRPGAPSVRVLVDGTCLELLFSKKGQESTLIGIVLDRRSGGDACIWNQSALVQSLRDAVPEIVPIPIPGLTERVGYFSEFAFSTVSGIRMRVRADEGIILSLRRIPDGE
jgi:hypothetical protein